MGFGDFGEQDALKLFERRIGFVEMRLLLVEHGIVLDVVRRGGGNAGIIRHDAAPIFGRLSVALSRAMRGARRLCGAEHRPVGETLCEPFEKPAEWVGECRARRAGEKCIRRFYRVWTDGLVCI